MLILRIIDNIFSYYTKRYYIFVMGNIFGVEFHGHYHHHKRNPNPPSDADKLLELIKRYPWLCFLIPIYCGMKIIEMACRWIRNIWRWLFGK